MSLSQGLLVNSFKEDNLPLDAVAVKLHFQSDPSRFSGRALTRWEWSHFNDPANAAVVTNQEYHRGPSGNGRLLP